MDGAVLSDSAFVLRWFASDGADRLLVVNFGSDATLDPAPEPLLAPPHGGAWQVLLASEDPRYGGHGIIVPVASDGRWRVPSECAVVLQATEGDRHDA